ncbi:hypothetical protein [Gordonia tangerina]|uniref:Helix-turn-helix domain-containing protein n=1 Tax=Gordonia tangerina TaxID=2911060 RepID=A0ABS9DRP5_9ACTN|nr:hypothetical protein [Gordonia tangerina]MCF3940919.1 hypothetical protein [Gordonia tangerina]
MSARALGTVVQVEDEASLRYLKFAALAALTEFKRRDKQPPPVLTELYHAAAEAYSSVAESGHEDGPEPLVVQPLSPEELIGSAEAATILGVTQRQIRRLSSTLDGEQLANGAWVFRRDTVEDYRQERRDARRPRRQPAA